MKSFACPHLGGRGEDGEVDGSNNRWYGIMVPPNWPVWPAIPHHGPSRPRYLRKSRHRHRLNLEHLEDRRLLALTITWQEATGHLTIFGDEGPNQIALSATNETTPFLAINGDTELPLNGVPGQILASSIRQLTIDGQSGNDELDLSEVTAFGFPGLWDSSQALTVFVAGGEGHDHLVGSSLADQLLGGSGNDRIEGGWGNDQLVGGVGRDVLVGEGGSDLLVIGETGSFPLADPSHSPTQPGQDGNRSQPVGEFLFFEYPALRMRDRPEVAAIRIYFHRTSRAVESIEADFTTDVGGIIAKTSLRLKDLESSQSFHPKSVFWNASSRTARWTMSEQRDPPFVSKRMLLELVGSELFNAAGFPLFGDFNSPASDFRQEFSTEHRQRTATTTEIFREQFAVDISQLGSSLGPGDPRDRYPDGWLTPRDILMSLHAAQAEVARSPIQIEFARGGGGDDVYRTLEPMGSTRVQIEDSSGSDTLDFSQLRRGLTGEGVDLESSVLHLAGSETTSQTLLAIQLAPNLRNVLGTPYSDRIFGNSQSNQLQGGEGDDYLEGRAGEDHLLGGAGNDQLDGGGEADQLDGGTQDDTYLFPNNPGNDNLVDAGGENDLLDFSQASQGVRVDLSQPVIAESIEGSLFRLFAGDLSIEHVIGSSGNDELYGNDHSNRLIGSAGNDIIMAFAGDDELAGGLGIDILDPGSGLDQLDPGPDFDEPEIDDSPQVIGDGFQLQSDREAFNQTFFVGGTAREPSAEGASKVRWMFAGIPLGSYEIFATWPSWPSGTRQASFRLPDGRSVIVDQSSVPTGPLMAGKRWDSLGVLSVSETSDLPVELRASGMPGDVLADAVRIVRVGAIPKVNPVPLVVAAADEDVAIDLTANYPLGNLQDLDWELLETVPVGVTIAAEASPTGRATIAWPSSPSREVGSFQLTVRITDRRIPTRYSDTVVSVRLGQANQAPQFAAMAPIEAFVGDRVLQTFVAEDPDGSQHLVRYRLGPGSPSSASLHPITGRLGWETISATPGTYHFEVHATDQGNPPRTSRYLWSVHLSPRTPEPYLQLPPSQSLVEDSNLSFSPINGRGIAITGTIQQPVTLGMVAEHGLLQLGSTQGLTFEAGSSLPSPRIKVRGLPQAINQALVGLQFTPTPDFRGTTNLRFELDRWSRSTASGEPPVIEYLELQVLPQLEAPLISNQVFLFDPQVGASGPFSIGTVAVVDRDQDQLRRFRILSGNSDQAFHLDESTGDLSTLNSAIVDNGDRTFVIEAYYLLRPLDRSSATVTIRRVPVINSVPWANPDEYQLRESGQVTGNILFGDAVGGIQDSDPNGDPLVVLRAIDGLGREIPLGQPYQLPSGVVVTLLANGSISISAGQSVKLDQGLRGMTEDHFQYTATDPFGETSSASVSLRVEHENDPLVVSPQQWAVPPTARRGAAIGRLLVSNIERSEQLSFVINHGNEQGFFSIDASGTLRLDVDAQDWPESLASLSIDVWGEDNHHASAVVQVRRQANSSVPRLARTYRVAADLPLSGNVLSDIHESSMAQDPDGGALEIVEVLGQASLLGRELDLAGGGRFMVNPTGSFSWDPRNDVVFKRLAVGERRTQIVSMTVRDDEGSLTNLDLELIGEGRNRSPLAFDNSYPLTSADIVTGNLIRDIGPSHNRDFDPNQDDLHVIMLDQHIVSGRTSITTRLGGGLTAEPDGSFTYDARNLDFTQLPPGSRLTDEIVYTIRDPMGGTASSIARFLVTKHDLAYHSFQIGTVGLVNDTFEHGGDPTDLQTEDPRIQGALVGIPGNAAQFRLEVDIAALNGEELQDPSLLNPDYQRTLSHADPNFPAFEFDPRTIDEFGPYGVKGLAIRAVALDGTNAPVGTSPWKYFVFDWIQGLTSGPIRVADIDLYHDTTTYDPNGYPTGHTDRITGDPRILGAVRGNMLDPPLAAGATRTVRIELTHENSGQSFQGQVVVNAAESFLYDPRTIDPGLRDGYDGLFVVTFSAYRVDRLGSHVTETWLRDGSTTFYYSTPPNACATVTLREEAHPTPGYYGNVRTVAGSVSFDGSCTTLTGQTTVELDYADTSGVYDDIPDAEFQVFGILTAEHPDLDFQHQLTGLVSANPRIRARVRDWSSEFQDFQYGVWSSELALSPLLGPTIANLSAASRTVENRQRITVAGYLQGAAADPNLMGTPDLAGVASVPLQFFYRSELDQEFMETWEPDGTGMTDLFGSFEHLVPVLSYDTDYRVWARTVISLPGGGTAYGEPIGVDNIRVPSPILPQLGRMELVNPSAATYEAGRWRTKDTRVEGEFLAVGEGGIPVSQVRLEFAHDYLHNPHDDTVVAGADLPDPDGTFNYEPILAIGPMTLRARVSYFDPLTGTIISSPWQNQVLPLDVLPGTNLAAVVGPIRLLSPDQTHTNPPRTRRAILGGQIMNPDGYLSFVPVELRDATSGLALGQATSNAEGQFTVTLGSLAPGTYRAEARTYDWNYLTRTWEPGPWSMPENALPFVIETGNAAEVVSFGLLSDTDPVPGVTANSALWGQVGGLGGLLSDILVAIDHDNDGSYEDYVSTDSNGWFSYFPVALPYGTHHFAAKIAAWNRVTATYDYSEGKTTSFVLEAQPNRAPTIVTLGLRNANGAGAPLTSIDIDGRIANEGRLEGLTVELDLDLNDDNGIAVAATTDRLGQFTLAPQDVAPGQYFPRVRTREAAPHNGYDLVSPWITIPAFQFEPASGQAPTFTLGLPDAPIGSTLSTTGRLSGRVQRHGSLAGAQVNFSQSQYGTITGVTAVDATGNFSYTVPGLTRGEQTIWAQVRIEDPASPDGTATSLWQSLRFQYQPPVVHDLRIAEFRLLHDVASPGGSTGSDGSTSDSGLFGQIERPGGALSPLIVSVDLDQDFVGDAFIPTLGDGSFRFLSSNADPGFHTVKARVVDEAGNYSSWKRLHFVLDDDASSDRSLRLVRALAVLAPNWQTKEDLDLRLVRALEQAIFFGSQGDPVNAGETEEEYQAGRIRAALIESLDRDYDDTQVQAEADFRQSLEEARQSFLALLASLPAADQRTYERLPYLWPLNPPANTLTLPPDANQPIPPSVPDYGPSDFDYAADLEYRAAVQNAQQDYLAAILHAEHNYQSQRETELARHEARNAEIGAEYLARSGEDSEAFEAALADNPDWLEEQAQEIHNAIDAAYLTYNRRIQASANRASIAIAAAMRVRDAAVASINQEEGARSQANTNWYFNDYPNSRTTQRYNQYSDTRAAIFNDRESQLRPVLAEYERKVANELRIKRVAEEQALHALNQQIWQSTSSLAILSHQFRHDDSIAKEEDGRDFGIAIADRIRDQAHDLAQEKANHQKNLSSLRYAREHALAEAQHVRESTIASAAANVTSQWAMIVNNPWADLRAQLAQLEKNHQVRISQAIFQRTLGYASAELFQSQSTAEHERLHAISTADTEYAREVALRSVYFDRAVAESSVARDYAFQNVNNVMQLQHVSNDIYLESQTARAIIEEERRLALADADEQNAQPTDTQHAFCLPDEPCSGEHAVWSFSTVVNNGHVRQRNADRHLRKRQEIDLNRELAILADFDDVVASTLPAIETYRHSANATFRNLQLANLAIRGDYQLRVAEKQDDYSLDMIEAAVALARSLALTESDVNRRKFVVQEAEQVARTRAMGEYNRASAEANGEQQMTIAANFRQDVESWGASHPGAWADYQMDLAQAELQRVTQLNSANIEVAERQATIAEQRAIAEYEAEAEYAERVFGSNGSFANRTRIQTQAFQDVVAANNFVDFVTPQFNEARLHQAALAHATFSLFTGITHVEGIRDRAIQGAVMARGEALLRARNAHAWDRTIDLDRLLFEANLQFTLATAQPNLDMVLAREELRRNWRHAVSDANLAQAEGIIAARAQRADRYREHELIYSQAVKSGLEAFGQSQGQALAWRNIQRTTIEGSEAILASESQLLETTALVEIENLYRTHTSHARLRYESELHAEHVAALDQWRSANNSPLASFQVLMAQADHTASLSRLEIEDDYQSLVSAVTRSQRIAAAELQREQASSRASSRLSLAAALGPTSARLEAAGSTSTGYLHHQAATARLNRNTANYVAISAADRESAAAAILRDRMVIDAEYAYVEAIASARAELEVICASVYFSTGGDCEGAEADFVLLQEAARDAFESIREEAQRTFDDRIKDLDLSVGDENSAGRMAYVTSLEGAKVGFVNIQENARMVHATQLAVSQAAHRIQTSASVLESAAATRELDSDLAAGLADARLQKQQRLRDMQVQLVRSQATAAAAYWGHLSGQQAAQWLMLANMNPQHDDFRYQAANAAGYSTWIAFVSPAVIESQADRTYALEQARFEVLAAASQYELSLAEALAEKESAKHNLTLVQQNGEAAAEDENAVQQIGQDGWMAFQLANRSRQYALDLTEAENDYRLRILQIEQQYPEQTDEQARNEAVRFAVRQRSVAEATARFRWRNAVHDIEANAAELQSDYRKRVERAGAQRALDLAVADANLTAAYELQVAQAAATQITRRSQITAEERNRQALAQANLVTAGYAGEIQAASVLDAGLNLPWSEFEVQLANQEFQAWLASRQTFLVFQANVGLAEIEYSQRQSAIYLQSHAAGINGDYQAAFDLAHDVRNLHQQVAARQFEFAEDLRGETSRYRTTTATAERVYLTALAAAIAEQMPLSSIQEEYHASLQAAENLFELRSSALNQSRRLDLADAGVRLNRDAHAIRVQQLATRGSAQALADQALMAAYLDESAELGLESRLAELEQDYVLEESTQRSLAFAQLGNSPWSELARAEQSARHVHVTFPLADKNREHQLALARMRQDLHQYLGHASRGAVMGTIWSEAIVDHDRVTRHAEQVATASLAEFPTPEILAVPSVDFGIDMDPPAYFGERYPGIREVVDFGTAGHFPYWDSSLWGSPDYSDQVFMFRRFHWSNVGWDNGSYSNDPFENPYKGYWTYSPWGFSWGGWSPNYSPPPRETPGGYRIDPQSQIVDTVTQAESLTAPQRARFDSLKKDEDLYPPTFDSFSGTLSLGDLPHPFGSPDPIAPATSPPSRGFIDESPTARVHERALELANAARDRLLKQTTARDSSRGRNGAQQAYDFAASFHLEIRGQDVYLTQGHFEEPSHGNFLDKLLPPSFEMDRVAKIGVLGKHGWVDLAPELGGGRATLTSLELAAANWNSEDMQTVLRLADSSGIVLNGNSPLQQLVDGVRSPHQIAPTSDSIGIFLGGTDMHLYGIGNVEKLYSMFKGTKFYYGGVGNRVDSEHPILEGAGAFLEFEAILDRAEADLLKYGPGRSIYIFGWSRGGAQAAELARRLEAHQMTVQFVGMFDPVYSLYLPGQQSRYVSHSVEGLTGNYVERDLSANIQRAVAIYAMNEVRSWFPATIMQVPEGSETELFRLSSPGAHGEIGGHWASNIWIQQLNLHQMLAYVPNAYALFDQDRPAKDAMVQKSLDSVYTMYLAVRGEEKDAGLARSLDLFDVRRDNGIWDNLSKTEYISIANSKHESSWAPGALSAQTSSPISNLSEVNSAALIEITAVVTIPYGAALGLIAPYFVGLQPVQDHYKRDVQSAVDLGLDDLYPSIDGTFIDALLEREINPRAGGWRN